MIQSIDRTPLKLQRLWSYGTTALYKSIIIIIFFKFQYKGGYDRQSAAGKLSCNKTALKRYYYYYYYYFLVAKPVHLW